MTNMPADPSDTQREGLSRFTYGLLHARDLAPKVGYGLLFFASVDILTAIYPLNFSNPTWEFELVAILVERVIVPLLGFVLIFSGGGFYRGKRELLLLRGLSWLSLIICFSYIPLTALGLSSAVRIDRQNNQELTARINEPKSEANQLKKRLDEVSNIQQLREFMGESNRVEQVPDIPEAQFESVKLELSNALAEEIKELNRLENDTRKEQRTSLIKRTIRSIFGAILSGVLFFFVWKETKWAR